MSEGGQEPGLRIDRRALQRALARTATRRDAAPTWQDAVRAELHARLAFFTLAPRDVLDAGCGDAGGTLALRRRFRRARVLGLDLSDARLRAARARMWPWRRVPLACGDIQCLPLPDASQDLVVSSLALQWCEDLPRAFGELRRVLRPGGLLLFATLGAQTLHELRTAWAEADEWPHVSPFVDMPALGDALARAGFAEPVLDRETLVRHHADVRALVESLRAAGAGNALADRRRSLTGRGRLARMQAAYERLRSPAGLPATWEVLQGAAFAAPATGSRRGQGDEAVFPLTALKPVKKT